MNTFDLDINRGETYSLTLTLTDANGSPMDLTNCVASGLIKFRYSDNTSLINLNPVITGSSGIAITLPATGTANLPITVGVYDVEVLNTGNNVVTKALMGKVNIFPEVTY